MKKNEENTKLYQEYLKTKDIQCLHQIILNNDEIIKNAIIHVIKETKFKTWSKEELYSIAYEGLFHKLKKTKANIANSQSDLGIYIRRSVLQILEREIRIEKEKTSFIEYNRLMKKDTKATKVMAFREPTLDEMMMDEYEKEVLYESIKFLKPQAQKVLYLYIGFNDGPQSYAKIAKALNISSSRVQEIIEHSKKILPRKARYYMHSNPTLKNSSITKENKRK